eukprot:6734260-Prymnesium_polylepis.2
MRAHTTHSHARRTERAPPRPVVRASVRVHSAAGRSKPPRALCKPPRAKERCGGAPASRPYGQSDSGWRSRPRGASGCAWRTPRCRARPSTH